MQIVYTYLDQAGKFLTGRIITKAHLGLYDHYHTANPASPRCQQNLRVYKFQFFITGLLLIQTLVPPKLATTFFCHGYYDIILYAHCSYHLYQYSTLVYSGQSGILKYQILLCMAIIFHSIKYSCFSDILNPLQWRHRGGGCMWVHLHPIHAPVHPPFACVAIVLLFTQSVKVLTTV